MIYFQILPWIQSALENISCETECLNKGKLKKNFFFSEDKNCGNMLSIFNFSRGKIYIFYKYAPNVSVAVLDLGGVPPSSAMRVSWYWLAVSQSSCPATRTT